ncbi:hypothetical protein DFA_05508 [Cavenderia fasciculata]|uniref:Uncharacterized protein n=1 Tax=Cavenderia fasciculata TaxID=261658 RepID=F4PLF4_CACFS|nr:uncharacterized protein DFA_05508 [Cavenderia fasciculata]EGG23376.1 hypothetical protein DFA_05508 [Cavenderia fasciculata]|eukprot:XP_004361227.1 hypothetical protein DFA_05508 [Cavenderia fasciculata]
MCDTTMNTNNNTNKNTSTSTTSTSAPYHVHSLADNWSKLQPILEKVILKNNIPGGLDRGMDIITSWFETISKSSDKINIFKSIVGLIPDEDRKGTTTTSRLSYSTSSISDLIEKEEFEKKRLSSPDDEYDFRNKRMKVSRLLCNEDINSSSVGDKSDEENSDGPEYDEENSSLESNSPNGGAADEYGGSDSELQIDEADFAAQKGRKTLEMSGGSVPHQSKMGAPNKNNSATGGANASLSPSPKQLMIIREKMLDAAAMNMERHAMMSSASENSSSSPEASPTMPPRRGRLPSSAPLMSLQSRGHSFPFSRDSHVPEQPAIRFPQDDMASLLWAAEIKQRETDPSEPEIIQQPSSSSSSSATSTSNSSSTSIKPKYTSMILSPPKQTAVPTR